MSAERKDGGPAFPRIRNYVDTVGSLHQESDGMTLRDWFAGQAMLGTIGMNPNLPGDKAGDVWPDAVVLASRQARYAYLIADALLAARGEQP